MDEYFVPQERERIEFNLGPGRNDKVVVYAKDGILRVEGRHGISIIPVASNVVDIKVVELEAKRILDAAVRAGMKVTSG